MRKSNYFLKLIGLCILLGLQPIFAQVKVGTNPTAVDPSAAFEVENTNSGVLISRMSSDQRDAIATPANGLLIFNLSTSRFEVYKTSCACWVTFTDAGNTPASSVLNTPPTASSLNYSGRPIEGQVFTLNYTYSDAQNDAEGSTTFQWQVASSPTGADAANISGATAASYTPIVSDPGMWIRATVTPRAATGITNGLQTFGAWVQVDAATIPTANNLMVSGTTETRSLLSASYTFSGGSGVENTDSITGTTYTWETATTSTGIGITTAPLYHNVSFANTFIPQSDLLGRFVRVGVRARDDLGLQAANFVFSPWVGPVTVAAEQAPTANNLSISPAPAISLTLTGSYTYNDVNDDLEGASTFQWFRADDANGLNQEAIPGATSTTYTVVIADGNKYLGFGVTPIAQTGTTTGTQNIYYHPDQVLPAADFTFTANPVRQLPFFTENREMNTENAIEVEIDVTTIGVINFSSTTVNGYSFAAIYTASTAGNQWVTLTATGTQTTYNSAGDAFTITGLGMTTENKAIDIYNIPTGANLTSYSNGSEVFSDNGICATKAISTGHTLGSCIGSVTVGANTYNLILINGQCWMQSNLKEQPSQPCADSINSGCNVWTTANPNPGDQGLWGYYNVAATSGVAGWGVNEPAANEGLLYQWSAAMNGETHERAQGICPPGFHIPSDCEWMYLEHGQGMTVNQQTTDAQWRGVGLVSKLIAGMGNSSGFSGIFSGRRWAQEAGIFTHRLSRTFFWTSTGSSTHAFHRHLYGGGETGVFRREETKDHGYSVRCLKDWVPEPQHPPMANQVSLSPAPLVNAVLTGNYVYFDANFDVEGATSFQWYRADDVNGTNQEAIPGATSITYSVTAADVDKFIGFGVTPVAQTGIVTGSEVISYHPTITIPRADFVFTSEPIRQGPFFAGGRIMNQQNTIQVEIDVTTNGGIVFSTNLVNGYSFSASLTITNTGKQWVSLPALGTQTTYNSGGDSFTLTGDGTTTETKGLNIYNSLTGNDLIAHSNGVETFNDNGTCANATISAGHTAGSCSGSISVGPNTYNLVLIQGQCWMQEYIKEAPSTPCADSMNTGCNIWTTNSPSDVGMWGYYNETTTDGSAGWGTTEPFNGVGLLYQWSAAMNGATHERAQGVCPEGWHVPSDCEWMYLEHGQGMSISEQEKFFAWRNTTGESAKLRAAGSPPSGAHGNNSSGLGLLFTGNRNVTGSFVFRNGMAIIWTSTMHSNGSPFRRRIHTSGLWRDTGERSSGFAVRCLKD